MYRFSSRFFQGRYRDQFLIVCKAIIVKGPNYSTPIPRWPSGMFKAIGTGGHWFESRSVLAVPKNCYWSSPFQYNVAGPTYYYGSMADEAFAGG